MHLEVLVEDKSGSIMLEVILPKILGRKGTNHTWRIHSYKGIGRIPKNLQATPGRRTRLLLHRKLGYPIIGRIKCEWAAQIAPHMDVNRNKSRSFQAFRDGVKALAGIR